MSAAELREGLVAGMIRRHRLIAVLRRIEPLSGLLTLAEAPVLDPELIRRSIHHRLPFIPGALTPTEALAAWSAGATFVKIFPASATGPALVRELGGPLRQIELIPTGGVDATSAGAFLVAGAVAVGIGGAIVRADAQTRRAIVSSVSST